MKPFREFSVASEGPEQAASLEVQVDRLNQKLFSMGLSPSRKPARLQPVGGPSRSFPSPNSRIGWFKRTKPTPPLKERQRNVPPEDGVIVVPPSVNVPPPRFQTKSLGINAPAITFSSYVPDSVIHTILPDGVNSIVPKEVMEKWIANYESEVFHSRSVAAEVNLDQLDMFSSKYGTPNPLFAAVHLDLLGQFIRDHASHKEVLRRIHAGLLQCVYDGAEYLVEPVRAPSEPETPDTASSEEAEEGLAQKLKQASKVFKANFPKGPFVPRENLTIRHMLKASPYFRLANEARGMKNKLKQALDRFEESPLDALMSLSREALVKLLRHMFEVDESVLSDVMKEEGSETPFNAPAAVLRLLRCSEDGVGVSVNKILSMCSATEQELFWKEIWNGFQTKLVEGSPEPSTPKVGLLFSLSNGSQSATIRTSRVFGRTFQPLRKGSDVLCSRVALEVLRMHTVTDLLDEPPGSPMSRRAAGSRAVRPVPTIGAGMLKLMETADSRDRISAVRTVASAANDAELRELAKIVAFRQRAKEVQEARESGSLDAVEKLKKDLEAMTAKNDELQEELFAAQHLLEATQTAMEDLEVHAREEREEQTAPPPPSISASAEMFQALCLAATDLVAKCHKSAQNARAVQAQLQTLREMALAGSRFLLRDAPQSQCLFSPDSLPSNWDDIPPDRPPLSAPLSELLLRCAIDFAGSLTDDADPSVCWNSVLSGMGRPVRRGVLKVLRHVLPETVWSTLLTRAGDREAVSSFEGELSTAVEDPLIVRYIQDAVLAEVWARLQPPHDLPTVAAREIVGVTPSKLDVAIEKVLKVLNDPLRAQATDLIAAHGEEAHNWLTVVQPQLPRVVQNVLADVVGSSWIPVHLLGGQASTWARVESWHGRLVKWGETDGIGLSLEHVPFSLVEHIAVSWGRDRGEVAPSVPVEAVCRLCDCVACQDRHDSPLQCLASSLSSSLLLDEEFSRKSDSCFLGVAIGFATWNWRTLEKAVLDPEYPFSLCAEVCTVWSHLVDADEPFPDTTCSVSDAMDVAGNAGCRSTSLDEIASKLQEVGMFDEQAMDEEDEEMMMFLPASTAALLVMDWIVEDWSFRVEHVRETFTGVVKSPAYPSQKTFKALVSALRADVGKAELGALLRYATMDARGIPQKNGELCITPSSFCSAFAKAGLLSKLWLANVQLSSTVLPFEDLDRSWRQACPFVFGTLAQCRQSLRFVTDQQDTKVLLEGVSRAEKSLGNLVGALAERSDEVAASQHFWFLFEVVWETIKMFQVEAGKRGKCLAGRLPRQSRRRNAVPMCLLPSPHNDLTAQVAPEDLAFWLNVEENIC